uniref:Uncharacterized protein n=1 Tax=Anguilla anguilla TaxID=7936 RepID=A0A0E9W516_ANGAN
MQLLGSPLTGRTQHLASQCRVAESFSYTYPLSSGVRFVHGTG